LDLSFIFDLDIAHITLPSPLGLTHTVSPFCLSLRPSILCGLALGAFAARVTAAPVDFGRDVRPFLDQHCVSCHGPKKEKGGVRLHTMGTISETPQFANTWLEVREQLLSGEMPPEDEKQPSEAARKAVIAWIDAEVERAQRESASTGGKVVMRRLNRNEYRETLREILHLHPAIDTALGLPDDDTFHGFDNIGSALNISSAQMRAYVENAARVLKMAFPAGKQPATEKTRIIAMDSAEFARISDDVARRLLAGVARLARHAEEAEIDAQPGAGLDGSSEDGVAHIVAFSVQNPTAN
jgi:hypothetical protein